MKLYVQPSKNPPGRIKNILVSGRSTTDFQGMGQRKLFADLLSEEVFERGISSAISPVSHVVETPTDSRRGSNASV